jgi:hypothetical protein
MMNGYAMSGWGWLLMTLGLLGFWALVAVLALALLRRPASPTSSRSPPSRHVPVPRRSWPSGWPAANSTPTSTASACRSSRRPPAGHDPTPTTHLAAARLPPPQDHLDRAAETWLWSCASRATGTGCASASRGPTSSCRPPRPGPCGSCASTPMPFAGVPDAFPPRPTGSRVSCRRDGRYRHRFKCSGCGRFPEPRWARPHSSREAPDDQQQAVPGCPCRRLSWARPTAPLTARITMTWSA